MTENGCKQDIQEAIAKIEKYAVRGRQVFDEDELIQIWMIHNLQIVGEASASMSEEFVNQHPEIPWIDIADFRNVLVHQYFRVDVDIVWFIVKQEIPKLKNQIEMILPQLD
jgi:uncharacterized protein with HEPN domain